MINIVISATTEVVNNLPIILKDDKIYYYMTEYYRGELPRQLKKLQLLSHFKQNESVILDKQLDFLSTFFKSIQYFDDFCYNPVLEAWTKEMLSRICDFSCFSETSKNMIILEITERLHDILNKSTK